MRTTNNIVSKVFPRNGAENFPLDKEIVIEFSQHMLKHTVENKRTITISTGKGIVPAEYEYKEMQRSLHITPVELKPGQLYRVKINSLEEGPQTVFEDYSAREYSFIFITEGTKEEIAPPDTEAPTDPVEPEIPPTEPVEPPTEETPTEPEDDSGVIYDPLEDELNNLHLVESFPDSGDLVELDSYMVFNFNKSINKTTLQENMFVKESKINSLLEKLNKNKLIKGVVEAENETEEDKAFTFKPNEQLKPGIEYQVVIKKELHDELNYDIRINFQTLFERMFADVGTVRLVLGAFAERLTDLELAKLINQQSNSIYQLASMMDSFNESDWAVENGVIVTFPYAASQYVVYSTAYYAILGRSLEGSSGMSESIRLADLSVSGSSESSDNLSDLLELLKAEFERWWDVLQGKAEEIEPGVPNPNYSMAVATRGGDNAPYPDFQTRVPFNELGGRDT